MSKCYKSIVEVFAKYFVIVMMVLKIYVFNYI